MIDNAVVSTFIFKKKHELSAEKCAFLIGKLKIIAEDLIGRFVAPFVLAHVEVQRMPAHGIILYHDIVGTAAYHNIGFALVLFRT